MKTPIRRAALSVAALTFFAVAGDLPFLGKWKVNLAKSDFGNTTVTYESMSGGEMKMMVDGQSYNFKTDGKDYPTPWGTTSSWKSIDANTWESTGKVNGKVTGTDTIKLSADGKTLTVDSRVMEPGGGSHKDSMTFSRESGASGLAGKWKTRNLKSAAPNTIQLTASGPNGLKIVEVNEGGMCDAQFDGKDYPSSGPMWPAGWTCAIAKNGAMGFDLTWKKEGKAMYQSTLMVSGDGKTITETGSAVGVNEKTKAVYDRQ